MRVNVDVKTLYLDPQYKGAANDLGLTIFDFVGRMIAVRFAVAAIGLDEMPALWIDYAADFAGFASNLCDNGLAEEKDDHVTIFPIGIFAEEVEA